MLANRDDAAITSIDAEIENRAAREHLLPYVCKTSPGYIVHKFHSQVASALESLSRREIRRLAISSPPRAGKTHLASMRFPAWYLGQPGHERHQIIACGYGDSIVSDAGRELRNLLQRPEHQEVFPQIQLATDSRASDAWRTTSGAIYHAAGTGSGITGRGMDLGIIDDAVRGHEDADSLVVQERNWKWWLSDFLSRRMKDSVLLAIGTRWGDRDLMGMILAASDENAEDWVHLNFPAIEDDGNALVPGLKPLHELEETRASVPARVWNCLYMGNPVPDEGAFFPADKLIEFDQEDLLIVDGHSGKMIPRPLRYYGASDFSVTPGAGDYTVHMVVGVDPGDNIYIVDLWRGQAAPDESIDAMIDLMQKWKPMCWAQERGIIDRSLGPFVQKRMNERKAYYHLVKFASVADKMTRAQSILGRISMSKVHFPKHENWWPELQAEMVRFPLGMHDDQVDALALIGRMLAGMVGGSMPPAAAEPGRMLTVGGQPTAGYNLMTMNDLWAEEEALKPRRRRRR